MGNRQIVLTEHEVNGCCRFARRMARRVLAEAAPWVHPDDVLMQHFGADIWFRSLDSDAVLVPILRGPEAGRFCVVASTRFLDSNPADAEGLRWTLTHELGHLACGHHFRYPGYQEDPRQEKLAEIEANTFAEEFLMPVEQLHKVA